MKFLFFIFFILLSHNIFAAKFVDRAKTFSFEFPSEWSEKKDADSLFQIINSRYNSDASINLVITKLPTIATEKTSDIKKLIPIESIYSKSNPNIVFADYIKFKNSNAISYETRITIPPNVIRTKHLIFIRKNMLFTFSLITKGSNNENADTALKNNVFVFNKITDSFKYLEKTQKKFPITGFIIFACVFLFWLIAAFSFPKIKKS